jgi:hypothetical protein
MLVSIFGSLPTVGEEVVREMKYFLDTEFIERGLEHPIELISIGIACEDGREFYAVSDWWVYAHANDWVQRNVIVRLGNYPQSGRQAIVDDIRKFVGIGKPEFWGYYAAYDWVVFAQLFGTMMDLPKGWPMYCHDIKQLCDSLGNPKLPAQSSTEHNALNDARWNKQAYEFLTNSKQEISGQMDPEAPISGDAS